jgi:hypothetical protein
VVITLLAIHIHQRSAFFGANPAVTALYFWNNSVLGAVVGANYATRTTLTGTRATSDIGSLKVPTNFTASGQGFFAQVSAEATLNFTNTMRSTDNTSAIFFRNTNSETHLFKLNLLSPNAVFNQIAIGYATGATNGFDNQIDAVPFADSPTMISSLINNVDYIIQGRSLPFAITDVVPMGFKTNVAGNYSMTSEAFEGVFAANQNIFLKDNLVGITHNIKQSPYSFTSNIGIFNNRFEIVYVNSVLGIDNPAFNENSVFVFKKDNTITVNSGTTQMKSVVVYDLRGRLVAEKTNINTTETKLDLAVEQQVLLVTITTVDNQKVTKKIVY